MLSVTFALISVALTLACGVNRGEFHLSMNANFKYSAQVSAEDV